MLADKYINHAGRIFKWRRLILEAVVQTRNEKQYREEGMPKDKRKSDPTATKAIRNLSMVDTVKISPWNGRKPIYVQHPEEWLAVIEETYAIYAQNAPLTKAAMQKLFENGMSGETLAGLMGISKQSLYRKRYRFLLEAVLKAAEMGILDKK